MGPCRIVEKEVIILDIFSLLLMYCIINVKIIQLVKESVSDIKGIP
jgi:hypothetical protein